MKDRDYSKTEVALYQVEKAIELYIEGNDYISCITLAGASEEITGRMVQRNGQKHFLERLKEYYKNSPEVDTSDKFYNWARQTRNALKHFNNESETHVYVCKLEAQQYVQAAVVNYIETGSIFTKKIVEFIELCKSESA
jgi:hypothetical protein